MQAQGGRPFGLSLAAALVASLGANALATSAVPVGGWWLASGLGLSVIENPGISFGLASGVGTGIVTAAAALVLAAAAYALRRSAGIGLGLLLGGGLANLVDRLGDGHVTDYIALGPWPTFNVADAFVTVGAVLILTRLLRRQ